MQAAEFLPYLAAFLFCIGLCTVIIKRNAIIVLLGIELMLNATNLNLVFFNVQHGPSLDGQIFALFVIIVAVCEAAIGLAIVLTAYKYFKTSVPDQISELKN